MVSGTYVNTFAEASHALPDGMHMNSDYPLMLPRIAALKGKTVTLRGRDGDVEAKVQKDKRSGREYCSIAQVSTYERIFRGGQPTRWKFFPFKDQTTPAIVPVQKEIL